MPIRPGKHKPNTPKAATATVAVKVPTVKPTWGGGRGGRPWRRLREQILIRDNYLCQCCLANDGRVTMATEVDHIVNVASGGTDDWGNLSSICAPCHKVKTARESNPSSR